MISNHPSNYDYDTKGGCVASLIICGVLLAIGIGLGILVGKGIIF